MGGGSIAKAPGPTAPEGRYVAPSRSGMMSSGGGSSISRAANTPAAQAYAQRSAVMRQAAAKQKAVKQAQAQRQVQLFLSTLGKGAAGLFGNAAGNLAKTLGQAGKTAQIASLRTANPLAQLKALGLSDEQARTAATVLSVGRQVGATPVELKAAIATGLVEDNLHNNPAARDGSSIGWRQETKESYPNVNRMDVKASAGRLFSEMKQHRGQFGNDFGALAQAVQGSNYPERYGQHGQEADRIVRAFKGTSGASLPQGPSFRGITVQPGIVGIINAAKKFGLDPRENALIGKPPAGGHQTGYIGTTAGGQTLDMSHYAGRGVDLWDTSSKNPNYSPKLDAFGKFLSQHKKQLGIPVSGAPTYGGKYGPGVMYQEPDHFDHLHVSAMRPDDKGVPKGALKFNPKYSASAPSGGGSSGGGSSVAPSSGGSYSGGGGSSGGSSAPAPQMAPKVQAPASSPAQPAQTQQASVRDQLKAQLLQQAPANPFKGLNAPVRIKVAVHAPVVRERLSAGRTRRLV